jgi:hypothetical protein
MHCFLPSVCSVDETTEAIPAVECLIFLGRNDLATVFPLVSSESELVSPAGIVRGMRALHARPDPMPLLTLSVFISLAQPDQMIKWFFGA